MQKLNNALKILSETEKQLRISKNQTTWFTVALLQLSSVDYQSVDANDTKLSPRDACNGGELGFLIVLLYYFQLLFPLDMWNGVSRMEWFCQIEIPSLFLKWIKMVISAIHYLQGKAWIILLQACVITSHTD